MSSQPSMYQESLRAFLKPILRYLDDPAVSEIMINGPEEIWIESKGKVIRTDARFTEEGLLGAARNVAQFVGRTLTDERPRLDARLPDGSRIHVVLAPIARRGTTIAIRKFFKDKLGIDKLVEFGSMTAQMAYLVKAMVHTKLNLIVSGGTGSGKTTLLNIVSTLVPNDERILTIEDSAELQLQQEHIVSFESRPADKFGKGEVNMGHLLHSALRLRPDRIVVGEVRGGEAYDLMQAMNTGHGGSMATTHANTPTDTLRRLESLCLQSAVELPMVAVRAQVASAINVIVSCERYHDGSRRTTAIAEVLPLDERGDYRTQNLFVYTPTHKDPDGRIHGYHAPTGILPTFLGRMRAHGFPDITEAFFDPATYGVPPPPEVVNENFTVRWAPSLKHRERGEPDPADMKAAIARAQEFALKAEARQKELVAQGKASEGYRFVDEAVARRPVPPARPPPEPPREPEALEEPEAPPPIPLGPEQEIDNVDTRPPRRAPRPGEETTGRIPRPIAARPPAGTQRMPAIDEPPEPDSDRVPGRPVSPPPRTPYRDTSGLPPGKRPLPSRAPPRRSPEADAADERPARSDDQTFIGEIPDRPKR